MPDRRVLTDRRVVPVEVHCPLGFVVRPAQLVRKDMDCGHTCCYPASCERLRRLGAQVTEERKAQ